MTPLRAIFFDAGNTLFRERRTRAAIYAEVARHHGIQVDDDAVARSMEQSLATLPARIPEGYRYSRAWFRRFIPDVFARLGHPTLPPALPADLFTRFERAETFEVFDDVEPALRELSTTAAGPLTLGVVSNWSEALPELLERLGLARWFGFVVVSAIEQVEKPDPAIFRRALLRARVAAVEALHVGDQLERDVAGARAAGIRSLLLDREGRFQGDGARRIRSLRELLPLLPLLRP